MSKAAVAALAVLFLIAAAAGGYWLGQSQIAAGLIAGWVPGASPPPSAPADGSKAGGGPKGGGAVPGVPPPIVEAFKVAKVRLPQVITAVGSLRSDESIIVRPEVTGRISAILFQEGQHVNKGATLITLDPAVNAAEVEQANANLALARAKHQRSIELKERGFISAQARDEAENNLKVAEAAVALAQARLAKMQIRAPFSGIIGLRSVSLGDYVKEGQDLVNLESIDPLKVDFRVPEIHLGEVRVGQSLEVSLDAVPGKTFEGRVFAVNPLVDAAGRSFVIRAVVRNPDRSLRPGLFARVRLLTKEARDTLVVPEQALVPQGQEQYVFRIVDGKAVRVKVRVGQRGDGKVEIVEGLDAGDVVVTAGQLKIRDGAPVRQAAAGDAGPAKPGNGGGSRGREAAGPNPPNAAPAVGSSEAKPPPVPAKP